MRTSPIHYIAPSAISIIPNCNNSANDLAVTVARGAKILVYSPATNIPTVDGSYQEWTFAGRNRRLADSTAPYTVYVRLPRDDRDNGYVVFVAKDQLETEEGEDEVWVDHYSCVTNEGNGYSVLYQDAEGHDVQNISQDYYYIRLGDVSKPTEGARSIDLDTGILGTDAYNNQWSLNPDELPLRIELSCTVRGEDAGPTPYVYWGQILTLTAKLVEGWEETTVARFHHWVIARSSGDVQADMAWPIETRAQSFANSGQIPLSHNRGAGDDFNGAVSALFTVTAMGVPDTPAEGEEPQETVYTPLAQATVNIQAETVEKYDLQTTTDIVSYNPQDGSYTPAVGVTINVRATDQRGNLFNVTRGQFHNASLAIEYAAVGSDQWTALTVPSTPADSQAQATLPISAFQQQQSVNLRLVRVTEELYRKTVAFVRDGEDSGEREWIFLRSTDAITFGDASSQHPLPSLITVGEVNPTGAASGTTPYSNTLDGWVPQGWWDEEQGVDATNCYEYASYRDHIKASGSTPAHWGAFTTPIARNHWGRDGQAGETPAALYTSRVTGTAVTAPVCTAANYMAENLPQGWSKTAPNRQVGYDVWMSQNVILTAADGTYSLKNNAWSTPVRISGDKGDPGADSGDREWIYIRTNSYPYGGTHPKNISRGQVHGEGDWIPKVNQYTTDDYVPEGWSDRALATEETAKYVYTSWRDKQAGNNQQWGDFQDPIPWSNWGVQGIDGDGVQYLFKLFANELDATARESQKPPMTGEGAATFNDQTGEWECTGWSDDPLAPTSLLPFCYCSIIHEINGSWGAFGTLGLWSKWSADGTSPYVADITNEMDSVACDDDGHPTSQQSVSTVLNMFHGSADSSFRITSVKRNSSTSMGTGVTLKIDGSAASLPTEYSTQKTLQVTYATTATVVKDDFEITMQAQDDSSVVRTLHFTVNGVKPGGEGKDAVIYNLLPSADHISAGRTDAGAYTPSTGSLTCGYTKNVGGAMTTVADVTGQIDSTYNIYFRKRNRSNKQWQASYYLYYNYKSSTNETYRIQGFDLAAWDCVEFILCTETGSSITASMLDQNSVIDRETVPVIADGMKGDNGTSPWIADLDNEMDSVACDVDGKPEQIGGSDQSVVTNFKLFHGITEEEFYISSVLPSSRTGATIVATPNTLAEAATSGSLTITYAGTGNNRATIEGKDEFVVTLTAKSGSTITRQLTFTVNGVRPGAKGESAVIYQLKPSMSSIPFQRLDDDTLTPISRQVSLIIVKSVGGTITEYSTILAAGVNVRYSTSAMPASSSAGTSWGTSDGTTGLSWNNGVLTVSNSVGIGQLYIAMFNRLGTLLDRETIPVIKDGLRGPQGDPGDPGDPGEPGSDGWTVTVNPSPIILNQAIKPSSNPQTAITTDFGLPLNVSITAKHGSVSADSVVIDSNSISAFTGLNVTRHNSDYKILVINSYTPGTNVPTKGVISCEATLTEGNSTVTVPVSISVAINMLGSFVTTIEGDVERSIANKTYYIYDENGNVVESKTLAEYIRSSSTNSAKLSKQNDSNNLFPNFADGWESYGGDTTPIVITRSSYKVEDEGGQNQPDLYSPVVRLMPNTTYCFSAYFDNNPNGDSVYALMPAKYSYTHNSDIVYDGRATVYSTLSWQKITGTNRYRFVFTTPNDGVIRWFVFNLYNSSDCYLFKPQLEKGNAPTDYCPYEKYASESETVQTAEEIDQRIRDDLGETGINISGPTKTINLQADRVTFTNSTGTVNDKIWIDPTYGTLHAVDGYFSGTLSSGTTMADAIYTAQEHLEIGQSYPDYGTWRGIAARYKDTYNNWTDAATFGARYQSSNDLVYGYVLLTNNDNKENRVILDGYWGSVSAKSYKITPTNYGGSSKTLNKSQSHFVAFGDCATVNLPSSPEAGEIHIIRNARTSDITINSNSNTFKISTWDNDAVSSFTIPRRYTVFLFFDGSTWYANRMQ